MAEEQLPIPETPEAQAPSLIQVAGKVRAETKPKAQSPARGDDLMAEAQGALSLNDEENEIVKRFTTSKELVDTRMQQDPAYAEVVMQRLQKHEGETLVQAMIDEADDIKIEFLKRSDPGHFNSEEAARAGAFNTATFGQLTRIMGGAGVFLQGRKYEEVVREQGEKFRLMAKAFPKSNLAGQAAGFLIPGSPVKMLFEKAAGLGAKGAGALLSRMVKDPNLLTKAVQSGAGGGLGAATIGGIQGTAGSDMQGIDLDRGAETALSAGAGGLAFGVALPLASAGLVSGATKAAPYVRAATKAVSNSVARGVEQLSGVSVGALRAYNKDPKAIRGASNSEGAIASELVDFLQNSRKSLLPESKLARELLPQMPDVDGSGLIKFMKTPPPNLRPDQMEAWSQVKGKWAEWVENRIKLGGGSGNKVPAKVMREIVDDLQDVGFDKNAPFLNVLLRQAQRVGNDSIRTMAGAAGKNGEKYLQLMEKAAEKQGILKFLRGQMGIPKRGVPDPAVVQQRAQNFVTRIFGKNKEAALSRMRDLDTKFGTNFVEQAQNANYASQLGPGGKPALFSNLNTGKAALGVVTGGAMGGTPGAIAGSAASSPKAGAFIVGSSDKITGFIRRMVANPAALDRLGKGNAAPLAVRTIALEISRTINKDGPISAAGVTRLVADTPYFLGLVHAFELAERQQEKGTAERAVVRMQHNSGEQLATPQTNPKGDAQ